ncbi:MAG: hypothetical protein OXJ64_18445 [Boseongicola sp.]|nr:hypothetical protein [Boseongicola sp.]
MSLAANATLFVGGVVYGFVDEFVEQAFGLATAAATQRKAAAALKATSARQARSLAAAKAIAARQRGELSTMRAAAARQQRDMARLRSLAAKQAKDLAILKAAVAERDREFASLKTAWTRQGRELAVLGTASGKLEEKFGKFRQAATAAAKRSQVRLIASAGRSIATAPGKALPVAGVPIVAVVTVWEIEDLCATIRDMDEIRSAADGLGAGTSTEVRAQSSRWRCGEQILAQIGDTSREGWREIGKYLPDLPSLEEIKSLLPAYDWGRALDGMKRLMP